MKKLVTLIDKGSSSDRSDDDLSDRLNSRYTVLFLVVFAVVVSTQLYIGSPVTCWCPKEFSGSWITYTNNFCWVKNTYYLPFLDEIPKTETGERGNREILYYQWLPFILLLQAVLFYMPSVVWHAFNQKAGVDCDSILHVAHKFKQESKGERRNDLAHLIFNQLDRFMRANPDSDTEESVIRSVIKKYCCICCRVKTGRYLCVLYLFSKLLYMANVIAQLFILNLILKRDFAFYGYELIQNVINDKYWVNSNSFPRVTMCDFTVRRLGNLHTYTVQCVLPINMYTEKIYAFLWVWMLIIAIISTLSFFQWLLRAIFIRDGYRYVRYQFSHPSTDVAEYGDIKPPGEHAVQDFVDNYLRPDGLFVLRLIGHNTNNMTVSELTQGVFKKWEAEQRKKNEDYGSDVSDLKSPLKADDVDGQ